MVSMHLLMSDGDVATLSWYFCYRWSFKVCAMKGSSLRLL